MKRTQRLCPLFVLIIPVKKQCLHNIIGIFLTSLHFCFQLEQIFANFALFFNELLNNK